MAKWLSMHHKPQQTISSHTKIMLATHNYECIHIVVVIPDTGGTRCIVECPQYAHHQDCITITIVEFNGKPYSVCIDSESRIISCSVNLNSVNLTQCVSLADNSLARGF